MRRMSAKFLVCVLAVAIGCKQEQQGGGNVGGADTAAIKAPRGTPIRRLHSRTTMKYSNGTPIRTNVNGPVTNTPIDERMFPKSPAT